MCQKADPLVSGTVRKLVNRGTHLVCMFSTYTKRRSCYSSTKLASTVDSRVFYLFSSLGSHVECCTVNTQELFVITLKLKNQLKYHFDNEEWHNTARISNIKERCCRESQRSLPSTYADPIRVSIEHVQHEKYDIYYVKFESCLSKHYLQTQTLYFKTVA